MKNRISVYPLFFGFLISISLLSSCSETKKQESEESLEEVVEPKFDLVKAKAEIQAANDAFCKLIALKDSVGLADMYTEDAKFMNSGGPSAVGTKQIKSAMHEMFEFGITEAKITTLEVFGSKELLVEESNVLLYVGDQQVADEKGLVVWKKVDGKWKLFRDIFNSNVPEE